METLAQAVEPWDGGIVVDQQRPGVAEPDHAIGMTDDVAGLIRDEKDALKSERADPFCDPRMVQVGIFTKDLFSDDGHATIVDKVAAVEYEIDPL